MTQAEINNLDLSSYKDDSETGLTLEVDLEYPHELHNLNNK